MKERVVRIDKNLALKYGEKVFKNSKDPLTELVFTILSQNTNDTNRDRAYKSLKREFPTWDDTANASHAELMSAIKTGGLAKTKATWILKMLNDIKKSQGRLNLDFLYNQTDEQVNDYLQNIDGVGPKTVACVLAFSLGRDVMPVDTHVRRVSERLGILPPDLSACEAHSYFLNYRGTVKLYQFHLNLIQHGRQICRARKPLCEACFLAQSCGYNISLRRKRRAAV